MSVFKPFEIAVIRLLVPGALTPAQVDAVVNEGELASDEHTGGGYFLEARHAALPQERLVCDQPIVVGRAGDIQCGFVIFIEDGTLTLECHTWGPVDVPADFREMEVQVEAL